MEILDILAKFFICPWLSSPSLRHSVTLIHLNIYREGINFYENKISRILVDSAKISSFENYWKYLAYSQNFSFFSHLLPHPSTMLCHLDPFWTYWQNFWFFSRPLAPSVTDSFWMYWQNISFFLNSSRTLWLWSILDILAKVLIFPSAPCPCQALRHIHFGYIGNTFSFSPHHLPNPYHALWLCSILENFAKYFIFLWLPNPIPPPPNTLWFWSIWDILVKFFIFHAPLPSLPISVTLIRFGHIGKVFHFSLIPSPLLSSFRKLHWSILEILVKHFIFPSPLPPLPPTMLCDFDSFWTYF